MDKNIKQIIENVEKTPDKYKGGLLYDFVMERKNLADRESAMVESIKTFQREMSEKMTKQSRDFLKLKGSIEYVESKILEEADKL